MVTLRDVANKAGVAVSTASYALNNSSKISLATRKKVYKAARDLGYQPHGIARNLKKQKTETIGLFLNDLSGPYYSEVIQGVQDVVSAHGYDLIVGSASGGTNSTAYKFLLEKRVDGAVILAPKINDAEISRVAKASLPIIVLDRRLDSDYIKYVLIDNLNGAYQAVSHLINRGYHKIVYLSGPEDSFDNQERFKGYQQALLENGFNLMPQRIVSGNFTEKEGYQVISGFLAQEERIDAIFSANDEMAIGAIQAIREMSFKIPDDIAIVGFDDIRLASYINPPLTTIRHPKYEMGRFATNMVFQVLHGSKAESVVLPTQLITRQST